ncbi:MAG: hypothetical protein H7256_00430 [Bdellovibrio sp.]|nr:hypothetical protein [Bdellovibrio sp.]
MNPQKMTFLYKFTLPAMFGIIISCSPTKFSSVTNVATLCDSTDTSCAVNQSYATIIKNFKIGSGKIDILFVNDNSASMSSIQTEIANRFSGFIQNLDAKKIDYKIAVTTTDVPAVTANKLTVFGNGKTSLTNVDSDRVSLFRSAIQRNETLACETFIVSMFNTYGLNFQSQSDYAAGYPTQCPSPDTRGIYTANYVLSKNSDSFLRSDANLSVILISNDDVRQGRYLTDSAYALDPMDTAQNFTTMMNQNYRTKYWDFNSIIVKDSSCQQQQVLKNAQGQVIVGSSGQPAVKGGIGQEYANLSNAATIDINNNPRPRGQTLDICQSNYAQYFNAMATQISDASRQMTLKCKPTEAPNVVKTSAGTAAVPFVWDGNDKITFQLGTEGTPVTVSYRCLAGAL